MSEAVGTGARTQRSRVMEKSPLTATVYERSDSPGVWAVEAINIDGDGEIYLTLFDGPHAEPRALEYARAKYGHGNRSTPQRQSQLRTSAA